MREEGRWLRSGIARSLEVDGGDEDISRRLKEILITRKEVARKSNTQSRDIIIERSCDIKIQLLIHGKSFAATQHLHHSHAIRSGRTASINISDTITTITNGLSNHPHPLLHPSLPIGFILPQIHGHLRPCIHIPASLIHRMTRHARLDKASHPISIGSLKGPSSELARCAFSLVGGVGAEEIEDWYPD